MTCALPSTASVRSSLVAVALCGSLLVVACETEPSPGSGSPAGAAGIDSSSAGATASGGAGGSGLTTGGTAGASTPAGGGGGLGGQAGTSAQQAGAGVVAGSAGATAVLSPQPASVLWTGVRYYPNGTGLDNRTSGPATGPEKTLTVRNTSAQALDVTLALSGPDATKLAIIAPSGGSANIAPGAELTVGLRLLTDNAALGPAPAQDDGATVLNAELSVSGGGFAVTVRQYALILTYVELEPTFGQIMRAFPGYSSNLPDWLPDDANPNPGSPLPGVVPDTDEVNAPAFERLDPSQPVTLQPLARFSPPGTMPFGCYSPGNVNARTTVATMAEQDDPHTNDKSRLLDPPLLSGSTSFEPADAKFGIWMLPAGVGLLTSADTDGFDGQHRIRAFTLRDAAGAVIPGSFLLGGEEAGNGDYQDYVFVLGNVKPAP